MKYQITLEIDFDRYNPTALDVEEAVRSTCGDVSNEMIDLTNGVVGPAVTVLSVQQTEDS